MKRRISFLLTVCMVLTLMLGLFIPTTADDTAVGGEIISSRNGVIYSFGGIQAVDKNEVKQKYEAASKSGNYNEQYSYFRNEDGIVFAVYGGDSSWAEVSGEETLKLKNVKNDGVGMSFVSNFVYPDNSSNNTGFWGINAIAIRYRVLNQNADETIKFVGVGQWDPAAKGTCEIETSGEWLETIYELTPASGASQTFGCWFGEYMNVVGTNVLSFNGLSKGATIELDYIGLFTTVDEAQVEMNRRNSIRIAENGTFVSKNQADDNDGQVIRFTGIQLTDGYQVWSTDCGVTQHAPKAGRNFYNDAYGNLVMVTKDGLHYAPICIGETSVDSLNAKVIEMRYKTTDADGNSITPPVFSKDTVKVQSETVKDVVTTEDRNGWYVTRIYVDTAVRTATGTGLVSIDFPSDDTSMKYVIDYVGFFNNDAAADANTKRARVFDGDAVRFDGVQAKVDGTTGIRFVGVIDDYTSEAYEEFGFKFCLGDKVTETIATGKIQNYVYSQIMAKNADGETVLIGLEENSVTGQGDNSAYFTYCINEIPDSAFTDNKITFKVCVYAKIKGAEICGPTFTVVYDRSNAETPVTFH